MPSPATTALPTHIAPHLDFELWNRDGSAIDGFDPFTWLTNGGVQSEFENEVS